MKLPESEASAAQSGEFLRGQGCMVAQRRLVDSPACWAEGACGCGWRGHPEP